MELFSLLTYLSCIFGNQYTAQTAPKEPPAPVLQTCPDSIPNLNTILIKTPALQERKVEKLRLCNGLEVYIVSDPGADQSAAALTVDAGSWLDGPEYPGIAHFLEHLLFLGNKKYPEEDEFMGYVQSNGGRVNAFTSSDRTSYVFSINHNAFNGGLDRFSEFFISPLFSVSGVGREMGAVDQEYSMSVQNEFWRWYMVLKETGNPGSPNAHFACGNLETLGQIPPDEVKKWWKAHYSADQMHLVIYSNQSIDKLKNLVKKDFSAIEKRAVDNQILEAPLLSSKQLGHMIYIEPVREIRELKIIWELPPWAVEDLEAKLPEQLAYALSSGADNSLETLLKKEKLAESVSAETLRLSNSQALFFLSVDLTPKGVQEKKAVLEQCFQAIAGLKKTNIPYSIYTDLQKMALINYEWQTRQNAYSYVMQTVRQLPYESLSTYPDQTLFYSSYAPSQMQKLIDSLTFDRATYLMIAPSSLTNVQPDQEEKWYGVRYAIHPLKLAAQVPNPAIGLPSANPFIPTDLKILPKNAHNAHPVKIAQDAFGTDYYTPANAFATPEIDWTIGIKTPLLDGTAKSAALLDLYLRALNEKLSSLLFYASYAGLDCEISAVDLAMRLSITGYSDKARELLYAALKALKHVQPSESEFAIYKESLSTIYANRALAEPYRQAAALLQSVITNDSPTPSALLSALKPISYRDFLTFSLELFDQTYLESLFAGNLTEEEAKGVWTILENTLKGAPYSPLYKQFFVLDETKGPYAILESTPLQGNAALLSIQQGPSTYQKRAAHEILGIALSSSFFKTLRTKQQTGYAVMGFHTEIADQLTQNFLVQSATYEPTDLLTRFELFLETFLKDFEKKFSKSQFEKVRHGVVTTLTNAPTNLNDFARRQYSFAFKRRGNFDYLDQLASAVRAIDYSQIQTYANEFFAKTNRRKLAILLTGHASETLQIYHPTTLDAIREDGKFTTIQN